MAEENDSGLLREIDEELRQEQLASFAKRYGKYALSVAVLIVAVVGGYKGWQAYDISQRETATRAFVTAMSAETASDVQDALASYARLAGDAAVDIPALARMRQAALLAEQGDTASALDIYKLIAADTGIDQEYRDLARLYAAVHELNLGNPDAALQRLSPLLSEQSPWRHSARETAAVAHLRNGDDAAARDLLEQATTDPLTPEGVRRRSSQLLDSIGAS